MIRARFFLLFGLVLGAPVLASEEATTWLMKMNDAARMLNYDGVFVYVHGANVEVMRVVHRSDGGSARERIYSLNGVPREIIRDANQVWCYIPDKRIGVHEYRQTSHQNFPHILPNQINELGRNYHISLDQQGRVADRTVQRVLVQPKDDYRYGYDLWIDRETGLLLEAVLLDTDALPIERYMFTNITIDQDIPDSALTPLTAKQDLVWFGADKPGTANLPVPPLEPGDWEVQQVPAGFTLSKRMKRMSPMRKRVTEHLVYSDGLAAVSVFIDRLPDPEEGQINGLSRMGAIHAFGKILDGYQVTVVGEVPAKTVNLIGMSVIRRKQ